MTNAEAAKHFASLPADEPARISVINLDTATAEDDELMPLEEFVEQVDDPHDGLAKMVGLVQKW